MLSLRFDESLQKLLPCRYREQTAIRYPLHRRASIKDIIESLHIPHTEIASIRRAGRELPFTHIPGSGERLVLTSFPRGTDVTRPTLLRPEPLPAPKFAVDVNVGKLARLLRLAGIDTWYQANVGEEELARQAVASGRLLLSRNRDILRRKIVTWGRLVRHEQPEMQLTEVVNLYGLRESIVPFSRCLECNTLLLPVDKAAVLHRLEPLTRKYYHRFKRCPDCRRIYWQGSHHRRLLKIIAGLSLPDQKKPE